MAKETYDDQDILHRCVIDEELMNSSVCVTIARGTSREAVITILQEAVNMVSADWDHMLRG